MMMHRFTTAFNTSCQAVNDAVVRHSVVTAVSFLYTVIIAVSYYACLMKRRAGESASARYHRLGRFWLGAAIPKLAAAIALFTVLMPVGTSYCPFDSGPYYIYPSVSVFLCARWIARGFVLLKSAPTASDDEPQDVDHLVLNAAQGSSSSTTVPARLSTKAVSCDEDASSSTKLHDGGAGGEIV